MKHAIRHTEVWSVSLPRPLAASVEHLTHAQGRARSDVISEALRQYLVLWSDTGSKEVRLSREWRKKIAQARWELKRGEFAEFDNLQHLLHDLHQ